MNDSSQDSKLNMVPIEEIYEGSKTLPCVVCGCDLENVLPDHTDSSCNQPNDASALSTTGHYGDGFFDPGNGSTIEINICNACMIKAWENRRVCWFPTHDTAGPCFVKK